MANTKIGKYQIIEKIGQGGMGAVYKAIHPTLKKYVILKQLTFRKNTSLVERFKREARLMLELRDEHIVQVYDHFKEGLSYFIVMEYVDGIPLDKLVKEKRYLPNDMALIIFNEICKGLKHAHDKGIIHRDIKPANILISRDGEVKLTDFGIATSEDEEEEDLTKTGATLGSPAYMSPEQIFDVKSVDKRADIYSLGVLFYNMVTGKLPYAANISPETITQISKGKYISPEKINPKITGFIRHVIKKTMHCKKNRRYRDLGILIPKLKPVIKKLIKLPKGQQYSAAENQKLINLTLKRLIYGQGGKPINLKVDKTEQFFSKLKIGSIAAIIFIAVFSMGFFSAKQTGFIYEIIKTNEYGAVQIAVETIKSNILRENQYISAVLYRLDKSNKYTEVKQIKFPFSANPKKNTAKTNYFETPRIYLKSAQYKLDINVHNEKFQRQFFLSPRSIQKKLFNSLRSELIKVKYLSEPTLPLNASFVFKNIETNEPLNNVDIKILNSSYLMNWIDYLNNYVNNFVSGRSYYFEFSKENFLTNRYPVSVDPYQNVLNLDVNLVPVPGILSLRSNYKNIQLQLNNSNYYFTGGEQRQFLRLQPSFFRIIYNNFLYTFFGKEKGKYAKIQRYFFENRQIILAPGEYQLTIKQSGIPAKVEKILIESNRMLSIDIIYDKNKKLLNLNILKQ